MADDANPPQKPRQSKLLFAQSPEWRARQRAQYEQASSPAASGPPLLKRPSSYLAGIPLLLIAGGYAFSFWSTSRPSDVSEPEWAKRMEVCREAGRPFVVCLRYPKVVAEAEVIAAKKHADQLAEEARLKAEAEATRQAEELITRQREQAEADQKKTDFLRAVGNELRAMNAGETTTKLDTAEDILIASTVLGARGFILGHGRGLDLTSDEQRTVERYRKTLVKEQRTQFPKLRKAWGQLLDKTLWVHDVRVRTVGSRDDVIELTGWMYAANASKQTTKDQLWDVALSLRFKRMRFRAYDGGEGAYWEIASPDDGAIVSE